MIACKRKAETHNFYTNYTTEQRTRNSANMCVARDIVEHQQCMSGSTTPSSNESTVRFVVIIMNSGL